MLDEMVARFLYYPDRIPPEMPPPQWAGPCQEVWMDADDGIRIHGLWWDQPNDAPVVLFLHGNAQEVYSWSLVREDLQVLECRMLLIDYHGYGKSGGKPSEGALYSDGRAAMKWLRTAGVEPENTVVFGKSLGGAVACEIARGTSLKGLVLESTFTSLRSVARRLFPFADRFVPDPDVFNSLGKIPDIHCPVMVIHGDADALIPLEEGLRLFEAAGRPKDLYVVRGAGHNDVSMVAGREYGNRLRRWVRGAG